MDSILKMLAIVAMSLGLVACGEQGGTVADAADAGETGTEQHADHDHEHADDGHSHDEHGDDEQATNDEHATNADGHAEDPEAIVGDYPQATIDGAMKLFITSLTQGDFLAATDVCDNTSVEVQEQFPKRAQASTFPHTNPNVTEDIIAFVREQVSKPYRDATWSVLEENGDQVTVTLTLVDGRSTELTLVKSDDAWWIFPYDGFLDWGELSIARKPSSDSDDTDN